MLREQFVTLLAQRGWSLEQFSEVSGVPFETAKNIKLGKTTNPRLDTVVKMANAFDISINCLIGAQNYSKDETSLLEHYQTCGKHGKSIIQLIAKYEATIAKTERDAADKHKIPCLIPHNDLAKGIIYDACETTEVETTVDSAFVGIFINSNVFSPKYCKGDVILLENRFPDNGEYGAFYQGERAYIRKFIEEPGQYRLQCLHKMGEDIIVKRMDEIKYIGTCCGIIRS